MKRYGFGKIYFLLFIVVIFLIAGVTTTGFAVTLGSRGFVKNGSYLGNNDPVSGLGYAHSVAVSPYGKNLYVVGKSDDAIAVFNRDVTTGILDFVEVHKDNDNGIVDGLNGAISVIVSPDGENVYVAGNDDDAIAVFDRDVNNGTLSFSEVKKDGVDSVDGLNSIWSMTISPVGNYLYSISDQGNAVTTFSRGVNGELTFVDVIKDNDNGNVDGLLGGKSLAISPDGKHLYTAGYSDDSVALFDLDPGTGRPSFVEVYDLTIDPENEYYFGPHSLVISQDGKHVYIAGYDENSLAVFSRNDTTGLLTFVEKQLDGINDVTGLAGAFFVDISQDGKHVYVIGNADDSVVMFSRDKTDGKLTFVEMQQYDFYRNGLNYATSLAISPDNEHLYATGAVDGTLAEFRVLYTPAEMAAERSRWDANGDNRIGLEEAIQALRITSGL